MLKQSFFIFFLSLLFIMDAKYVSFFAHGIAANSNQARLFMDYFNRHKWGINERYIMSGPLVTFDFPDSVKSLDSNDWFYHPKKIVATLIRGNYDNTSFGQGDEIKKIHEVYSEKVPSDTQVIYGGISRGASIFFTWSFFNEPRNIAGAILESPYAAIADVIKLKREQLGVTDFLSQDIGELIVESIFRKYSRSGIKPIDCVKNISPSSPLLHTPILIIAAKSDVLVPWESSFSLYKELKNAGHKKVHFLLLEEGDHGFLLSGSNGKEYQSVVHAFYKHYGLPFDENLALQGLQLWNILCN